MKPNEMRILIVEDDHELAQGTNRLLERAGFTTVVALNADEAWRSLQATRPDLILLDRDLPDRDGMDLCRQIKGETAYAGIFLILISGTYIQSAEQVDALESGADGYIVRPIANRELVARIEAFVRILGLSRRLELQTRTLEAEIAKQQRMADMFTKAFKASPTILTITVLETGRLIDVNESFERSLGYAREEAIGRTAFELGLWSNPEERQRLLPIFLAERRLRNEEVHFCTKSGAVITCLYSGETVEINGEPCALAVINNITERRRAEQELRASEERFRRAVVDSPFPILLHAEDGEILQASQSWCEITGYTREELRTIGEWTERAYGERKEVVRADIDALYRLDHRKYEGDYTVRTKDGRTRIWEFSAAPLGALSDGRRVVISMAMDVTERRAAEAAFERTAREWQSTFDATQDAIWVLDQDHRVLRSNRAAERFFHRPCEEMLGHRCWTLALAGQEPHPDCPFVRARQSGHREVMEFQQGEVWLAVSVDPIRDAVGACIGAVHIVSDITERKKAEEEVFRMNRALELLSQLNRELVHATDEAAWLSTVCRLAVETGGYRLAWIGFAELDEAKSVRVVAKHGFEDGYLDTAAISWADVERGRGPTGAAIRTGTPVVASDIATDPTLGPWREAALKRGYGLCIALPLRDEQRCFGALMLYAAKPHTFDTKEVKLLGELADDLAHGILTLRERGRRERAELARQQGEEQLRKQAALLDAASDAIYTRTLDRKVTYWNVGAERLYGLSRGEALGREITELAEMDATAFQCAEATLIEQGYWSGELTLRSRQGKEMVLFCRWSLLRDEGGQPTEVLAINSDVTARKQLEAQFLRAQRLQAIGALTGGIAHDLNNVLAPLMMISPLLREKVSDPVGLQLLETVETSVQRGAEIVKQMLTFARGKPESRALLPVRPLCKEVLKFIGETFPRKIRSLGNVSGGLWPVLADATQVHQALLNLCVNARDAMPAGGTLTVAAENVTLEQVSAAMPAEARPGHYVRLSVADTGTGIPPEFLEQIYDPFFTTKELGKGTGLGLATVHGIMRRHGGFVGVTSQLGRGTTFELYFPASPEAAAAGTAGPEARPPAGQGELILVVDDETEMRGVLRRLLEDHGYRVLTAAEGQEALALFAQHRAEVRAVVTDLMMPGMDGPELVHVLRGLDAELPILGMTGLTESASMKGLADSPLPALLVKPFRQDKLLAALGEILARSQKGGDAGA